MSVNKLEAIEWQIVQKQDGVDTIPNPKLYTLDDALGLANILNMATSNILNNRFFYPKKINNGCNDM